MTPEQAASIANDIFANSTEFSDKVLDFLNSASPRAIQQFIHLLDREGRRLFYDKASTALEIKLSENADLLADKLSNQTDKLIKYTKGLWAFTLVLVAIAIIQIIIMIMDYCSKAH